MELLGIILLIAIIRALVYAIRMTQDEIEVCNILLKLEKKREQEENHE